ncbi:CoA transferase [Limoniibacter endophyticus]|uniref:2-methylfumaryl-CoA isomerase n=1 Tax=Limoniibacter endophyticus TaxID=1565040 RepID=A0A8J3DSL3_9HYPH|nr:CoA transferase [Limoniibacter endophyticus]GHC78187.1 2-methylfumaryl-CoA isomerase [Limoniibacter endophyticus]
MYSLLSGMRVVEGAAFVAAPTCCLHLQQMGAEVIRFDTIGGGPDFRRWPRAKGSVGGASLYWEGLNKGKKSIAIDLGRPEGRELATLIATAPGDGGGIFVTNYPVTGFLSHEKLKARRADMITVRVMGWADGSNAVDYTVNSALGVPMMTGPDKLGDEPVNNVLPAWDFATGNYAAFVTLAAERHRSRHNEGLEVRVPLGDIAMATLGNLGQVAEVALSGADRPRYGNDIFGAFGRDYKTADGRRLMIVGLTQRHWRDLVTALGIGDEVQRLETELDLDLSKDEGLRFQHRDRLNPIIAAVIERKSAAEWARVFSGTGVCWSDYNSLKEAISDPRLFMGAESIFEPVTHGSGETYLTPGSAATIVDLTREMPGRAPCLGEHTEEVLASVLGLSSGAIAHLHDEGVVASSATA